MGAAAAAENPLDANNVTMNSIDDATNAVVSEDAGGAESLLGASNDENILSADTGSFKELGDYITVNKGYGKTISLDKDYIFNNETDRDYLEAPIYLGTYVSIDGQGHTIDANNNPYIFNTIGQDIILKNIVFKNTNNRAIKVDSPNVEIIGCTFDNNTGRAVELTSRALNSVIDNCQFLNGQGVSDAAEGLIIRNSLFKNNTASNGAAINVNTKTVDIENCEFYNNDAINGVIYLNYDPGYAVFNIENSTFINNKATNGGAIYTVNSVVWDGSWVSKEHTVNIISSTFKGNKAVNGRNYGGPTRTTSLYVVDESTIQNSDEGLYFDEIDELFENVSNGQIAVSGGSIELEANKVYTLTRGPIYIYPLTSKLIIYGNNATIDANGNDAFYIDQRYGHHIEFHNITIKNANRAIYETSNNGKILYIYDSSFINNGNPNADGGAIFRASTKYAARVYVYKSDFINNTGKSGGAVYTQNSCLTLFEHVTFEGNTAKNGGAFFGIRSDAYSFTNTSFINNSAITNGVFYINNNNGTSFFTDCIFKNNTAYANPIGPATLSDSCTVENNMLLSNLPIFFENMTDGSLIKVNNSIYTYQGSIPINYPNVVVDGQGSTIIGTGNVALNILSVENVTLKNFNFINCTISSNSNCNNLTIVDCTFTNTTNKMSINGGRVKNLKFTNSTQFFNSNRFSVNSTNININGNVYNDQLYDELSNIQSNNVYTLTKSQYDSLTTLNIYASNTTIDGNGAKITSVLGNPLFRIYGNNVTIKNVIIDNASSAIYFHGYDKYYIPNTHTEEEYRQYNNSVENVIITNSGGIEFYGIGNVKNCAFNNCSYGIIFHQNANVSDSNFTNSKGNAISATSGYRGNLNVDNCNFKNIYNGRGINTNYVTTLKDSNFTNITSFGNGAALNIDGSSVNITNCNFNNNTALSGGSIYQKGSSPVVNVSKSTFDGGVAKASGGAIYIEGTLILDDCSLNNNTADSSGAIYSGSGLNITNSSLTNNNAVKGGALVSDGDNPVISGCNVSGNKADVGAGISLSGDNAVIDNVNFTDNTASVRGGALVTTGANTNVTNVNATGNSAPSGSAFVLDGDGAKLANSTVTDNKGVNGEGSAVEVNGENIDILNNTVQGNDGSGVLVKGNGTNITGNHFNSIRDISINPNSDIYNNDTIMKKLQDENHPAGQVEILNDVEPTIIVSDVNVQQNTTFNITILNDDFDGNVSVKLDDGSLVYNGTFKTIKDNDGIISGPVLPVAGEKTVTVFFYGDPDFNNKTVNTTFIVSRVTPQMNITVANVTYGNNSIVEVRIGNKANGTITITIDDVEIISIPIVDGNATYDLGVLPAGNKTANVQFRYNTSDYYNNNIGNFTIFCVDKAESSISIVMNDTYDIGEDVNITVSTTGSSGNLTFKINDTNYNVVNGTVNITGLALGEYTITATLDADENYTNKTVTKTFIIKKINTDLILLKK